MIVLNMPNASSSEACWPTAGKSLANVAQKVDRL
jgi:hypothetical protein